MSTWLSSQPLWIFLHTSGTMESKRIKNLYEPSPILTLYIGRVDDLHFLVGCHSFLAFLMATPPLPFHTCTRRDRRWPSNSGKLGNTQGAAMLVRSTPGCGTLSGLSLESVDFRERIRRKSKSEACRRANETRQARKHAAEEEEPS
jgi:hypothetical protein